MDENMTSPVEKAEVSPDAPARVSCKSFRRKYRKIMVTFDQKMRESNQLFREHVRVMDISRRLSEQNDQLLELLHDLNSTPQVDPRLRYNLLPPGYDIKMGETRVDDDKGDANTPWRDSAVQVTLRKSQTALNNGEITLQDYRRAQRDLLVNEARPLKSYVSLLQYLPKRDIRRAFRLGKAGFAISGFPALQDETKYLAAMDSYLAGDAPTPRVLPPGRAGDRVSEREKEVQLNNPVSVYNWLRKNQPQVFLQDNEANPEKTSTRPAASRTKRASTAKQDPELYDDDGIAIEASRSAKGKRKRDDDGGYRPKGGNGRASKRTKGDTPSKKGKKKSSSSG